MKQLTSEEFMNYRSKTLSGKIKVLSTEQKTKKIGKIIQTTISETFIGISKKTYAMHIIVRTGYSDDMFHYSYMLETKKGVD